MRRLGIGRIGLLGLGMSHLMACSASQKTLLIDQQTSSGTDFHMHVRTPPMEADGMELSAQRALFAADSAGLRLARVASGGESEVDSRVAAFSRGADRHSL